MAGKTHSRYLSPAQAQLARQQIEQGHKLREQVEQYREACEQWADAQLERSRAASREAAEKGAPNRPSKRNRPGNRNTVSVPVDRRLGFRSVELAARGQSLRLAARALEQRLNTDTSDHVGPQLPCSCGGSAQYHGRHGKTFESVLGPLHLQRAYGRLLRRIPVTSDPFSCRLQTTLTYRPSDSSQSWPKRQTSARSSRRAGEDCALLIVA